MSAAHELGAIGSRERCPQRRCGIVGVTRELCDANAAMNGTSLTDNVERFGEDEEEADRNDGGIVTRR